MAEIPINETEEKKKSYTDYLKDATASQKSAYDNLYEAYQNQLKSTIPSAQQNYNAARNAAYTTARVSAIGNNEQLAASGLAGNVNAPPMSGYSESSRVRQNIDLQTNINDLGAEERNAIQEIVKAMEQNQAQRASDFAGYDAVLDQNLANYGLQQQQNAASLSQGILESGGTLSPDQIAAWEETYGTKYTDALKAYNPAEFNRQNLINDPNASDAVKNILSGYDVSADSNYTTLLKNVLANAGTLDEGVIASILGVYGLNGESLVSAVTKLSDSALTANAETIKKIYTALDETDSAGYKLISALSSGDTSDAAKTSIRSLISELGGYDGSKSAQSSASAYVLDDIAGGTLQQSDAQAVIKALGITDAAFASLADSLISNLDTDITVSAETGKILESLGLKSVSVEEEEPDESTSALQTKLTNKNLTSVTQRSVGKAKYNAEGYYEFNGIKLRDTAGTEAILGKGSGYINKDEAEEWGFPNPANFAFGDIITVTRAKDDKSTETYYYMKRGGKWVAMVNW